MSTGRRGHARRALTLPLPLTLTPTLTLTLFLPLPLPLPPTLPLPLPLPLALSRHALRATHVHLQRGGHRRPGAGCCSHAGAPRAAPPCTGLQPYVHQAATLCAPGCNPRCAPGCNRMCTGRTRMQPGRCVHRVCRRWACPHRPRAAAPTSATSSTWCSCATSPPCCRSSSLRALRREPPLSPPPPPPLHPPTSASRASWRGAPGWLWAAQHSQ